MEDALGQTATFKAVYGDQSVGAVESGNLCRQHFPEPHLTLFPTACFLL